MNEDDGSGEEFISPFGKLFTKLIATRIAIGADGSNRIIDIETVHGINYKIIFNDSCRVINAGKEIVLPNE